MWDRGLIDSRLRASTQLGLAGSYFRRQGLLDSPEQQRSSSAELVSAIGGCLPPATITPSNHQSEDARIWKQFSSHASSRVRDVLWAISMAQWILLGSGIRGLLMHQGSSDTLQATTWLFASSAGLLITVSGSWWSSRIAFGEETPTLCHIGSFVIRIPAYKTGLESPCLRRPRVLMHLALGAVLLLGSILVT